MVDVALGLAGGFLEQLESTSIHLIQAGIARLLEMLPPLAFKPADMRRYIRLMIEDYDDIRDFIILHFHATARDDTPYWSYARTMAIPETPAEWLRIYRATGRVFRDADVLFSKTRGLAMMDGQGLRAVGHDPRADVLPNRASVTAAAAAQRMPPHKQFIARHCTARTTA